MTQQALPETGTAPSTTCKACGGPLADRIGHKNGYDLLRCGVCRTVTVDPWPTAADLAAFYQNYKGTPNYLAKRDKKMKRARGRIARLSRLKAPGKRLLDVGCNVGYVVAAAHEAGFNAFGIDIDEDTIAVATKEYGPHFQAMSIEDCAAGGRQADILYTSEVIEHVPDPDGFVAAAAKILVPGGILYLTTPDGAHFRTPKDFASWADCKPPEHITYFSQKGIAALLEKHGFKDIRCVFNLKPGIKLLAVKE